MALAPSGQLSLANVQTEFGGINPAQLSEYYKGGPFVLAGDDAPSVPASGPISLNQFHGAGAGSAPSGVTVSPAYSTTGQIATASGTATTATLTASASGGVAPISYNWAYVSGDSSITSHQSGATCYWTGTVNQTTPAKSAVWRVTATDARGRSVTSANVAVDVETTWTP